MNFKINGLVLNQKNFLNEQKHLTILTSNKGLIFARLKIGGQINRNLFGNVNVLGYYEFNVYEGRFGCVIDAVEIIELFFNLRYDPKKLALAQYFCELTKTFIPTKQNSKTHLTLLLNSLWLLCENRAKCSFVKTVFEFRLISISGYMPNLVGCKFCCCYTSLKMFYVLNHGFLVCLNCLKLNNIKQQKVELLPQVLHAMRFIIYKPEKQIFKFKLSAINLKNLGELTEKCVLIFSEIKPKTLQIYKQFC